jgi:hypothetical protein
MRYDVHKGRSDMYPASIINFLSNDDTPPFRAGSVISSAALAVSVIVNFFKSGGK